MNGLRIYNIKQGHTIAERKKSACSFLNEETNNIFMFVNKSTSG